MTKERFEIVHLRDWNVCDILDNAQEVPTFYNDLGRIESVKPVCDLLNSLDRENKEWKKQLKSLNKDEQLTELREENQMFRNVIQQVIYEIEMEHHKREADIKVWIPYAKYEIFKELLHND